ncbi:MAG: tetratricopeptide repeat protein [Bacteroidetes bacterium]|nr:tetratricopeptide repeat protein [Bacteroidota bacterium]
MSAVDRLEQLKHFLEQEPEDSFTRYALALEHLSRSMTAEGIDLLEETIARDPAYIPAYHMLGQQLALQGHTEEARQVYTRGISAARSTGDFHTASEMEAERDEME